MIFVIELGLDRKLSARDVKKCGTGTEMWNDGYDKEDGGVYEW